MRPPPPSQVVPPSCDHTTYMLYAQLVSDCTVPAVDSAAQTAGLSLGPCASTPFVGFTLDDQGNPYFGFAGLLRRPGGAIVVGPRHPERVEGLQHADVATGGVLRQVGGDPPDVDAAGVLQAGPDDADARGDGVAHRGALRLDRARPRPRHRRAG